MCKNRFPGMVGLILSLALLSGRVCADTVIIGNNAMPDGVVDAGVAKKLWLGKMKKLPGVGKVKIVDQAKNSSIRDNFYVSVTSKNRSQIKAYWAKIVFTGKALPPKSLDTDSDVINLVKSSKNVIGYVDSASVDDSVKVLYTVK